NMVYVEKYIDFTEGAYSNKVTTIFDTLNQYGKIKLDVNREAVSNFSVEGNYKGHFKRGNHISIIGENETIETHVVYSRYDSNTNKTFFETLKDISNGQTVLVLPISDLNGGNLVELYRDSYGDNTPKLKNNNISLISNSKIDTLTASNSTSQDDIFLRLGYRTQEKAVMDYGGNLRLNGTLTANGVILSKRNKLISTEDKPTTGTHRRGDISFRSYPVKGRPLGWVCVEAGTPGTWETMHFQAGTLGTISGAPDYIGQMASGSGGKVFIATGTESSADWKEMNLT